MKLKIAVALVAVCALVILVIKLIPEEQELPVTPVVSEYKETTYETTVVTRGDIINDGKVTASYQATVVQELYFEVDGYAIDEIYVQAGDTVEEGQLLAQLNMEDLESQLLSCQNDIETLELELSQIEETIDILYAAQVAYRKTLSADELASTKTASEVVASYESQKSEIEDELWIEELRLSEIEEKILKRQIYAPMDGIISYVRSTDYYYTSDRDHMMIKVLDDATSMFVFDSSDGDLFVVGDTAEIEVSSEYYSGTVVIIEPDEDGKEVDYYIQLDDVQVVFSNGDRGYIEVVYEQYLDVLYLPEDAIKQSKGQDIVYYLNEDGVRDYKYVETGAESDGYVEIISGVEEGDVIIVGWD